MCIQLDEQKQMKIGAFANNCYYLSSTVFPFCIYNVTIEYTKEIKIYAPTTKSKQFFSMVFLRTQEFHTIKSKISWLNKKFTTKYAITTEILSILFISTVTTTTSHL